MMINVMLMHGYMPDDMLASVLVYIPKDPRGSLNNSANYRAIALYSSIGKIVDMLISDMYSNQLMTSNAHFSFKKCHSTSMCRGDWGPLGHGVHWDTPSSRKSPTYRAHEMPFCGSLGTPIVQKH